MIEPYLKIYNKKQKYIMSRNYIIAALKYNEKKNVKIMNMKNSIECISFFCNTYISTKQSIKSFFQIFTV